MRFVNDKEIWQDNQVRLNISDPEMLEGEKTLGTFKVETTREPEMGNLVATNIRIYFRSSRRANSAPWSLVQGIFVTSESLTVEIAESADWNFRVFKTADLDTLKQIKKLHSETGLFREVTFRSPIIRGKQLDLLTGEHVISEIAGVWNVSGDAGNLGKLVVTNFRVVWFALLQENSNVSVPHLAVRTVETRNSKFGKILVLDIARNKGGSVLGFRIDPESALEKSGTEISRVVETASKQPCFGFSAVPADAAKKASEEPSEEGPKKSVSLLSRVVAAGIEEDEFCKELGLMVKKLPKGVTYKSLWEIA